MVEQGAPILDGGRRVWATFRDIALDEEPFPTIGNEFERDDPGAVRQGRIGLGEARLFAQRSAVDYAMLWLQRHGRTA